MEMPLKHDTGRRLSASVTAMVVAFNEAPNITRTLDQLAWVRRVVLIDSGSTDETLDIAARYSNVDVFHRRFDSFAKQCNYGLAQIESEWVLSLDADYELSGPLFKEIEALPEDIDVNGYEARFVYRIHGRPLRATLYPPRTVLYRRAAARYEDDGHGHRVHIQGRVQRLKHPIFHDDRKSLSRWFSSQQRYAALEADKLLNACPASLDRIDRLRRRGLAPLIVPFYCLLAQRLLLDGRAGLEYTFQRTCAEILLALELFERYRSVSLPLPPSKQARPSQPDPV